MIAYGRVGEVGGFGAEGGCGLGPCPSQDGCAIVQSALRDFAARLENDELLAGDQGEHGIGCGLGVFDEVAVDGERAAVEACQFDHGLSPFQGLSSAGKAVVNRRHWQMAGDVRANVEQV